jgi:hypothetical protein
MPERQMKIVRYVEVPATTVERFGKTDVVVTVMLEDMTTEVVQVPKETLTEKAIAEAVKARIAEKEKWQGKTIPY